MKPSNWRMIVITSVAVVLVLGLFAFGGKSWQRFTGSEEIVVAVATVKQESRPVVLRFSGELQPFAEVDVFSRLAGRLTAMKFKTGDAVSAGALVASVYSGETAERAKLVEAELNATRNQLQEKEQLSAEADKQWSRYQELYRQDLIARRDVEQAEIQAATARAQLELVRAQIAQEEAMLTQARKLQQLAHVVAPIGGVITGGLSVGAPVNEARALMTIAQIDTLKLVGEVPSGFAEFVRDGMVAKVSLRKDAAGERMGKVVRIDGKRKAADDKLQLEVTVDNRDRSLSVGAAVNATLTLAQQEQILTIPRSALQSTADKHYVFQIAQGRAVRRVVEIEDVNANPMVIRAGLKSGDSVIAERFDLLKEGLPVRATANRNERSVR